jgi:hypothetical protein
MEKSVEKEVPDGHGLADEGLVRSVSEVRQSVGPSCREAGAQRLRVSARARSASRPRGPELPLVQDSRADQRLAVRLYRPTLDLRPTVGAIARTVEYTVIRSWLARRLPACTRQRLRLQRLHRDRPAHQHVGQGDLVGRLLIRRRTGQFNRSAQATCLTCQSRLEGLDPCLRLTG